MRKLPGLLSGRMFLPHDKARLETYGKISVGKHCTSPHNSPYLTPSNFRLFPALKKHLSGHHQTCYLYVVNTTGRYTKRVVDGQSYAVTCALNFKGTMLKYNVAVSSLLCIVSSVY